MAISFEVMVPMKFNKTWILFIESMYFSVQGACFKVACIWFCMFIWLCINLSLSPEIQKIRHKQLHKRQSLVTLQMYDNKCQHKKERKWILPMPLSPMCCFQIRFSRNSNFRSTIHWVYFKEPNLQHQVV